MWKAFIFVGLGGALGSVLRYGISYLMQDKIKSAFPLPTFLVNIIGCLLMGILIAYFDKQDQGTYKLLFVTGFCGGFTTFSAFAFENIKLLQSGQTMMALGYIMLSIVLGLGAVWLGIMIMK